MKLDTKKITTWVMLTTVAVWVVWDVVVAFNSTPGDTISEIVLGLALTTPIVPFGLGVVVGHLLWPQYRQTDSLEAAVARGRAIHPWRGMFHQVGALHCEMIELDNELDRSADEINPRRVLAEATDVYVCARRIADGR